MSAAMTAFLAWADAVTHALDAVPDLAPAHRRYVKETAKTMRAAIEAAERGADDDTR